jgi:hypothetical protein
LNRSLLPTLHRPRRLQWTNSLINPSTPWYRLLHHEYFFQKPKKVERT